MGLATGPARSASTDILRARNAGRAIWLQPARTLRGWDMSRVARDPERGRAAAANLKGLGVKGILIKAAEQGYIAKLACKMPECFCPEELGGACYFEHVTTKGDWTPTRGHFPRSKRDGGHRAVDNAILAHRLCNRIDYSIRAGRPYARDLERVRKAREEAPAVSMKDRRSPADCWRKQA